MGSPNRGFGLPADASSPHPSRSARQAAAAAEGQSPGSRGGWSGVPAAPPYGLQTPTYGMHQYCLVADKLNHLLSMDVPFSEMLGRTSGRRQSMDGCSPPTEVRSVAGGEPVV